jgi:methyl-accepting chemotaxis protein
MHKMWALTGSFMGRLVICLLLSAIIPTVLVGYFSFTTAKAGLEKFVLDELASSRNRVKENLTAYLKTAFNNADFLAQTSPVKAAYQWLSSMEQEIRANEGPQNKGTAEHFAQELNAGVPMMAVLFRTWMEKYEAENNYQDLLIILGKDQGRLVYSFRNPVKTVQNLSHDPLSRTSLARLWQRIQSTKKPAIVDFTYFGAPVNSVVSFIGVPVFLAGDFSGILVLQIGQERIDEIVRSAGWRGNTGDAFIVGEDYLLRSNARDAPTSILQKKMEIKSSKDAFQNKEGVGIDTSYGTSPALVAWSKVGLKEQSDLGADFDWAVITKIDAVEALDPVSVLRNRVVWIGCIIGIIAALGGFLMARSLSKPVSALASIANDVNRGDLTIDIPKLSKIKEIGELGDAFRTMIGGLRNQTASVIQGINVLRQAASEISTTVSQVASGATETLAAITQTSATMEQFRQGAQLAGDKGKNMAQMAKKASEMSTTGNKATEDTRLRMNIIREQMDSIRETVLELSGRAQAIENIMSTVQDLADQSHLLAVNASIEAARAGEHGKGFSVVAQEIKALADQSKGATQQIKTILEDTRNRINSVVISTEQGSKEVQTGVDQANIAETAIQNLSVSVFDASQIASIIEATSEQQAVGVSQVSDAMSNINQAMREISNRAGELEGAVGKLSNLGTSLQELTVRYKV